MNDRTVNAQEFNRTTPAGCFDIGTLTIGAVLEVWTQSGSKYWITRVAGTHRSGTTVHGVSVSSDTRGWGRTTVPPLYCMIDRYIYLGSPLQMVGTGISKTSDVIAWRQL